MVMYRIIKPRCYDQIYGRERILFQWPSSMPVKRTLLLSPFLNIRVPAIRANLFSVAELRQAFASSSPRIYGIVLNF